MSDSSMRGDLVIRRATPNDIGTIADIHFKSYFHRFFDHAARDLLGQPYGAPLAVEHPRLAQGQTRDYFRGYWDQFARRLWDGAADEKICYVATAGNRVVGFVKGSGGAIGPADFPEIVPSLTPGLGELGSIYIDPASKGLGAGRQLVVAYARDMQDRGYGEMVSCAYHRNDSPAFFGRLGARLIGACAIPNEFIEDGKLKMETIRGVVVHWTADSFAALCGTADARRGEMRRSGPFAAFTAG